MQMYTRLKSNIHLNLVVCLLSCCGKLESHRDLSYHYYNPAGLFNFNSPVIHKQYEENRQNCLFMSQYNAILILANMLNCGVGDIKVEMQSHLALFLSQFVQNCCANFLLQYSFQEGVSIILSWIFKSYSDATATNTATTDATATASAANKTWIIVSFSRNAQ